MAHCTLNGLICRHKHLKDVLVEPEVDSPLSKLRGFCLLPRRACVPLNTSAFLFGHADFQAFRQRVTSPALSVARWDHNSTMVPFPEATPADLLAGHSESHRADGGAGRARAGLLLRDHHLGRLISSRARHRTVG